MTARKWTPAQQKAIRTVDRSVLVSAGAGAGKTAVLSERCVHLVLDARQPCNIDELLVVTFTEAAAAQMRERIGQALRARCEAVPAPGSVDPRRIEHQLDLLEAAQISTIHAFCRRILGRFFSRAGIDPQAPLLDEKDALLLRRECALRAFDAWTARDDSIGGAFLDLVAAYGGSYNEQIVDIALALDDFLVSLADPDDWTRGVLERMTASVPGELPGYWRCAWAASLRDEIGQQLEAVDAALQTLAPCSDVIDGFRTCLDDYQSHLHDWYRRLANAPDAATLDHICREELAAYDLPDRPRMGKKVKDRGDDAVRDFESAKEQVKIIRERFLQQRLQRAFGRFTAADWAAGIDRTRRHVETLVAFRAAIRADFDRAKQDQGVLDFNDLERRALALLRDTSNGVAARLRRQFRHVLVDEYQDVNPVQDEIVRLVSREADAAAMGNLFTVGDVKQSIYRFRLAEPRIFLDRAARFRGQQAAAMDAGESDRGGAVGQVIDLQENFRSAGRVLDAINGLFERLMARDLGGIDYDTHARLRPGRTLPPVEGPAMELHVLDRASGISNSAGTDTGDSAAEPESDDSIDEAGALDWDQIEREAHVIAERIHAERASGRSFGDIVILLRSMKVRTGQLVRALARMGVPAFADTAGSLFESIEVQDVLSLLALLDNGCRDIPLAAVLRSPLLDAPLADDDLAAIRIRADAIDRSAPFYQAAFDYASGGPDDAVRKALRQYLDRMADWRGRIRRRPVADVLWEIFEETGCLANVSGLPDAAQRRANLLQLHEYARQFGDFRRQGLHRFLRFLDDLQKSAEDLDAGSASAPAGDVVRIMTIHRSKGLEFPVVILGEAGRRFNFGDARGDVIFDRRLGLGLAAVDLDRRIKHASLPQRLVRDALRRETLAEELRVLYVALTRAERKLIVVGTPAHPLDLSPAARTTNGTLPLIDRRRAGSMLDWIVAALRQSPAASVAWPAAPAPREPLYAVHHYSAASMQSWMMERPVASAARHRLDQLAAFAPLPAELVAREEQGDDKETLVRRVARRLGARYRHEALTRIPAVAAASVLKRRWATLHDDEDPPAAFTARPGIGQPEPDAQNRAPARPHDSRRALKAPSFALEPGGLDATAVGTASHELLQRLDLRRRLDVDDLRAQCAALAADGTLSPQEAAVVDLDAIAWFFADELGQRLRRAAASDPARVLREWPFVLGVEPSRYDPAAAGPDAQDVMLVRGIIDCLFRPADARQTGGDAAPAADWEILDYKTDRVTGAALDDRAREYAGQLQIYAQAVEAAWRQRPRLAWLVFLHARRTVRISV